MKVEEFQGTVFVTTALSVSVFVCSLLWKKVGDGYVALMVGTTLVNAAVAVVCAWGARRIDP